MFSASVTKLNFVKFNQIRNVCTKAVRKGVIVGKQDNGKLTTSSKTFLNGHGCSQISYIESCKFPKKKPNDILLLPETKLADGSYIDLAVIPVNVNTPKPKAPPEGLLDDAPMNKYEQNDINRAAISNAVKALKKLGCKDIQLDLLNDVKCCAEAAHLGEFTYPKFSCKTPDKPTVIKPLTSNASEFKDWLEGCSMASGQNLARRLMELPSNLCTPQIFVQDVRDTLVNVGLPEGVISVRVRDRDWIEKNGMNAFLSVAAGGDDPPLLLEVDFTTDPDNQHHVALVGKGVTFDTGGVAIKPFRHMDKMRADMGGAAVVSGTLLTLAELYSYREELDVKLPNIRGYMPLCQNMVDGKATRAGDVVKTRCGLTVAVDNTDAEGRLLLIDTLHYALEHKPDLIIDLATLTGAVMIALGGQYTGYFANSRAEQLGVTIGLELAGRHRGDRLHRLPYARYRPLLRHSPTADLSNLGKPDLEAGAPVGAAFLSYCGLHTGPAWCHMDTAGVMEVHPSHLPYLSSGMSGRPTRSLAHFLVHEWPKCAKKLDS